MKEERVNKIIEKMKSSGLNQLIISSPADIFYLTGQWIETGERMMTLYLNVEGEKKFIINEIVTDVKKLTGMEVITYIDSSNPIKLLEDTINENNNLGIDKNWPSHFLIELMESNPNLKFENSSPIVDSIRMIKDEEESNLLREAAEVSDDVVTELISKLREGMTEIEACSILKELYKKHGTLEYSFSPIIAFGKNGADPHHDTDDSKLEKGQSVVIDVGGRTNNYCSDITRTVFLGNCSKEQEKVYNIVLKANKEAISRIKPGVKFKDIDRAARDVIEKEGYGKYFTHRTGHSIGIEDHENPSVSIDNPMEVKEGMTFSIEPGIYLEGNFGVRIEDIVLVTKDGCEVLNKASKKLTIV